MDLEYIILICNLDIKKNVRDNKSNFSVFFNLGRSGFVNFSNSYKHT